MMSGFRGFLTKTNALALAIGVIIGAAVGNIVSALVADVLMPIVSFFLPSGNWRDAKIAIDAKNAILYGHFLGTVLDFLIISFIVYLIVRALIRPAAAEPVKTCPECLETIPAAALRCRACTVQLS